MVTFNPRARGDGSLSDTLRARRLREEQLGRQRVVIPRDKPAPAATAGAIGVTKAYSQTFTSDAYGLAFTSWTFSPRDLPGGAAPTLVTSGADEFDPATPGWYQAHADVTVYLSGSVPPFVRLEVNPDASTNVDSIATDERALLPDGGEWFAHAMVSTAVFYHPGPNVANHFLGCHVSYPNAPGATVTSASVSYLLNRMG